MVKGFDSFRRHFAGYEDCYTIIGGTACDILMSDANRDFRATKDIDIILLIDARFPEFGKLFWDYIKEGGYRCGRKKEQKPQFFRFTEPQAVGYPVMIELFSRRPDFQLNHEDTYLTPLPITEDVSSLSAIMLDDDYYQLMLDGRRTIDGVSVLDTEYLMLFKAKAWIELTDHKARGNHVNDRDLRKHRADVLRLYNIADPRKRIQLPDKVRSEMKRFLSETRNADLDVTQYGIENVSLDEVVNDIAHIFNIGEE